MSKLRVEEILTAGFIGEEFEFPGWQVVAVTHEPDCGRVLVFLAEEPAGLEELAEAVDDEDQDTGGLRVPLAEAKKIAGHYGRGASTEQMQYELENALGPDEAKARIEEHGTYDAWREYRKKLNFGEYE